MTNIEFEQLFENGYVILDGAMGTNLYRAGMPRGVCTEKWILNHIDTVEQLQKAYVEAGSQVIYAPTFGANRHMLEGHGLADRLAAMNKELVQLSKRAAGGRACVAGDMSPTGLVLKSIGGDVELEEVYEIYREQAEVLVSAGVDLFAVETMMSQDETVIALDALRSVTDLPVMVTMSVQADGMAYMGGNIYDAAEALEAMGASAVGVNCCSGPDQLVSLVHTLGERVQIPVIAKPNAGMPKIDNYGQAVYDMDAEHFGMHMRALYEAGARMLGGCCGTTPEYIQALVSAVRF